MGRRRVWYLVFSPFLVGGWDGHPFCFFFLIAQPYRVRRDESVLRKVAWGGRAWKTQTQMVTGWAREQTVRCQPGRLSAVRGFSPRTCVGVAERPRESQLPPLPPPWARPTPLSGCWTPRLELCCLESAPPPDTRAPRYYRGPAIAPSCLLPTARAAQVKPLPPPVPRLFLPSSSNSTSPPLLSSSFSPSLLFTLPIQHPSPSFPSLSASFILILSLRFWSSTRYSCFSLVRLWLDTFPLFPFFTLPPRPRNDQPSTRILPVINPPPDTVRAYCTANSQFVFFVAVNVLRKGTSRPLRTLC